MLTIKEIIMNYYTFYLMNGQRKVFLGSDPQDAYCNNQTYKDGQLPIAYQEEGITDNYRWVTDTCEWLPIEPLVITHENINSVQPVEYFLALQLTVHNKIVIELDSNQLILEVKWENTEYGWLNFIEIRFERAMIHFETCTQDQPYIKEGIEYYSPDQGNEAISALIIRANNDLPSFILSNKTTLEDIYDQQSSIAMYNWEMDSTQKTWLLGSLIKRVETHKDIDKYIVETKGGKFICRPGVNVDILLRTIMDQIDYYCDEVLITDDGQRKYICEEFITKYFGFKFTVGENDAYGPLLMVIQTNSGKLVYG